MHPIRLAALLIAALLATTIAASRPRSADAVPAEWAPHAVMAQDQAQDQAQDPLLLPPARPDTGAPRPIARASGPERSILVLEQGDPGRPQLVRFMAALRDRLATDSLWPITMYAEQLDLIRFPSPSLRGELRHYLRQKYDGRRPGVILAAGPGAFDFVLEWRDELWPGSPVVFAGIDERLVRGRRLPAGVTGQTLGIDVAGTLALARRLFPETRHVAIAGAATGAYQYEQFVVEDVRAHRGDLEVIDLVDLDMERLRERIPRLPSNTIILFQGVVRDRAGRVWNTPDALRALGPAVHVPLFSGYGLTGSTGGSVWDLDSIAARTAEQLLAVLRGGDPATMPVRPAIGVVRPILDWRQLQRWGVPERRIPVEAELRFKPPTLWQAHRAWVLIAVAVVLAQAATIAGLLANRRQRRSAQAQLEERLRADALIAALSTSLRDLPPEDVDERILAWLERLGRFLDIDRVALSQLGADGRTFVVTHDWMRDGVAAHAPPPPPAYELDDFPAAAAALRAGRPWCFASPGDLPPVAEAERGWLERHDVRSAATLPLLVDGATVGTLGFSTRGRARAWPDSLVDQLQLVSDILAAALVRKRIESDARKNEAFASAMLASAARCVAIVDRRGVIVRTSDDWRATASWPDAAPGALVRGAVGDDYVALCRRAVDEGAPAGDVAARGIESVLAGRQRRFAYEYTVGGAPGAAGAAAGPTFHELTVERFHRHDGGAVVSHLDITARRRAEATAARQQRQVEHVARVATVGELAASIAHELNQPLGAILNNAHTAAFLLQRPSPPIAEVRAILDDIMADDERAATIIRHVRKLLRREHAEPTIESLLDVNQIVRAVQQLLAAESVRRRVQLEIDCEPELPPVAGTRVQLEQVLLNLVMNAFDAVDRQPADRRRVTVRTGLTESGDVEIAVQDRGPGIPDALLERLFEPFYTTKREGLGLGLSISRSIVDTHGGALTADNAPEGGAIVRVTWPAAPRAAAPVSLAPARASALEESTRAGA